MFREQEALGSLAARQTDQVLFQISSSLPKKKNNSKHQSSTDYQNTTKADISL